MQCPHCLVHFHDEWTNDNLGSSKKGYWSIKYTICPNCQEFILKLIINSLVKGVIYPTSANRIPPQPEVPKEYADSYIKAGKILADSPEASAALSRRCLQQVIREKLGITKDNLSHEIEDVLKQKRFPTELLNALDAIRNIGNFGTHPLKSKSSGTIIPVEPGEAEWNLDVLEMLFDYVFVQPIKLKNKQTALNAKLKDAGKPLMKQA